LKYFLETRIGKCLRGTVCKTVVISATVLVVFSAGWAAVEWKNVEAGSAIEAALYKLMPVGASKILGLRPPREAVTLLDSLVRKQPTAELYSLKAMNEEASLDFAAAEADWKKYSEAATDRIAGRLALADFYHRRLRPADEISALTIVGKAPLPDGEKLTPTTQQSSWHAFERVLTIAQENALPVEVSERNYRDWMTRYPEQPSVYSRHFQLLLEHKKFAESEKLIADYRAKFPKDDVFPLKARALLAYKKGSVAEGLAVYESNFQPLWDQELVQSYFDLMTETKSLRKFVDRARADLEKNPDDLNAMARIYYYYQRQGRTDAAQQTLTSYRVRKEERKGKWNSQELYTLAKLEAGLNAHAEAARYYFALYNTTDSTDAQEQALAGLTSLLMSAPEQNVRLGSSELSMYKDIATLDPGTGFLNGILSLLLNWTQPQNQYAQEEQRAVPYFHRAEAAELLRAIDTRYPNSVYRAGLHASLIEAYANYGESDAVIRDGRQFLAAFPNSEDRERVSLLMADAFERKHDDQQEFALYDSLLAEFGRKAEGVPLGAEQQRSQSRAIYQHQPVSNVNSDEGYGEESGEGTEQSTENRRAFDVQSVKLPSEITGGVRSAEYSRILERYLSRLVSTKRVPEALTVLRKELDRNPNDPGLYERLATFLGQNELGAQEEQVYQKAIQQFQERSWYHKLARYYLRQRRDSEFMQLSEQVVKIFSGTELEEYFNNVGAGAQYFTRLNEFAHQRFPHDEVFTRNLISAYWRDDAAVERLLRENWWQSEELRAQYFEFLARKGRLEQELAALKQGDPAAQQGKWKELASENPIVARFVSEADLWRSHFEQAAPVMGALAQQFPADQELGHRASAVFRSLAVFDPKNTDVAVAIEENLYKANPGDREELARIGDILSDRELFDRAAPYWDRMASVRPGEPKAYLDAAAVYWDYYNFNRALTLLNEGRTKLNDPALYSYEAGAIYENRREYPAAVAEYLKGALKQQEGGDSYARLMQLAPRQKLRDVVDQATAPLTEGESPKLESIKLRVAVLEAQNRPKDVEKLLAELAGRTNSLEILDWLEATAREKSFSAVQQTVLERQAAVTSDPIRKLELRYSLVQFYEAKKDLNAAQRNLEQLYRENPKILGVVRSTVDFYWRNREKKQAIDVLLQAAQDSYPEMRKQFLFEAARKQTDAAQYAPARKILEALAVDAPYNDEYIAAIADTYARSGDDQGLKAFYVEKIEQFKKASMSQDARTSEIAGLRRALIPALTRLKDYAGGVDQYIEVINKFPEDEALVSEASLYAQKYGRDQQLVTYYANTIRQSPKDYRWPMVLAKTETQLENYSAAIEAYGQAILVRPDRVDMRQARAELLERTMRFDEAAADYQKLFDLNYHDTKWMEKLASVRARQGRSKETIAALQQALIDNRPDHASNYFEVARRLESWGMLKEAGEFAQKGVDSAGRDLLATNENHSGAELYARIMTRLRQQDAACQRLWTAVGDGNSLAASFNVAVKQVEKNGIAAITDKQWREREIRLRQSAAKAGIIGSMLAMAQTVGQYFTPEAKADFGKWLEAKGESATTEDLVSYFLPVTGPAGLPEIESRWDDRLMLSHYGLNRGFEWESRLVSLQTKRMRYAELGAQLERYASTLNMPTDNRNGVLLEAARAYRQDGDYDRELRVLTQVDRGLSGESQERYFALLLQKHPEQLVKISGNSNESWGFAALQYTVRHAGSAVSQQAVAARGRYAEPVWTAAYSALAGLYDSDRSQSVRTSFVTALGEATIGDRISKHVDRSQQLAGNLWFYYGSRYGEWMGVTKSGDADEFLPAILEQSPGSASGYVTTAQYYSESGQFDRALQDYAHVLEVAPARADIHDKMAMLLWRQQKRVEAVAEWKIALEMFGAQVNGRVIPNTFWDDFRFTLNHIGNRKLLVELRPQVNVVLRDWVRRNGSYSSDGILREAFVATGDPAAGTAWMLELASIAPERGQFLQSLVNAKWIPASAKDPIYQQYIDYLQSRVQATDALARTYEEQSLHGWQIRYARYLVEMDQFDKAEETLNALGQPSQAEAQEVGPLAGADETEVRMRIAIARKQFEAMVEQYKTNPESAPAIEVLRSVATRLQKSGQRGPARKLLEYVYGAEIAEHRLTAANMLGLAEIRIQDDDLTGALQILRRLTLVVGAPFENLEPAASLLSRTGHHAEAVEFLSQAMKATPWDERIRLKIAQEQLAAGLAANEAQSEATRVARDPQSTYVDREDAATILKGRGAASLGSAELDLLASGNATPASADQPYFYAARLRAAEKTAAAEVKERLLRNSLSDTPNRDAARVQLFAVLFGAGKDRLAISAMEPMMNGNLLQVAETNRYRESSEGEDDELGASRGDDSNDIQMESALERVTPAQKLQLTFALGNAYMKIQEYSKALQFFRSARSLETNKANRAEIDKSIAKARSILNRIATNDQRVPLMRIDLEQDHVVRPRVVEIASASPKSPPTTPTKVPKGGAQ
jgi:cellulose synthase operon protein C